MAIFNKETKPEDTKGNTEQKISIIASGMVVEGTVEAAGDIRVEGRIKGTLICKARLVIGNSGHVDGNIDARNATIAGKVDGAVMVRDVLQVQETARINGDVITEKMNMQTGGIVTGQIKMGNEAKELIKKQSVLNQAGNTQSSNHQPQQAQPRQAQPAEKAKA